MKKLLILSALSITTLGFSQNNCEALKKENEALEEKLVDQAIGTLRELEKRRKFEGKFSAADELPQDWKQKFWTLPRPTRVRLEAEALKKLDPAQRKIPRLAEYYTQNILLPKILKEKKIFIPTKKEQKRIEETELRARKQQLCALFDKLKWTTERIKTIEEELLKNDD